MTLQFFHQNIDALTTTVCAIGNNSSLEAEHSVLSIALDICKRELIPAGSNGELSHFHYENISTTGVMDTTFKPCTSDSGIIPADTCYEKPSTVPDYAELVAGVHLEPHADSPSFTQLHSMPSPEPDIVRTKVAVAPKMSECTDRQSLQPRKRLIIPKAFCF